MNYQGHIELVTSIALVIVVFIGNLQSEHSSVKLKAMLQSILAKFCQTRLKTKVGNIRVRKFSRATVEM